MRRWIARSSRSVSGTQMDVDVDRRTAPADEDRRRTTGQVARAVGVRFSPECLHEALEAPRVGQLAHSAARSNRTSRRTSALYVE